MATTVEERVARLEERVAKVEGALARTRTPRYALTIEEAKERLRTPPMRGPEEYAQLERLLGSFDGPEDLSERMRDYLYGGRE